MAFDFPASPTEGQRFTPPGGPTYVYSAPAWRAQILGQVPTIADSAPASPINGQLWWESDSGLLLVYYIDPSGEPGQWIQVGGLQTPVAGAASPFKRTVITANTTTFQFDSTTQYADVEVQGGGGSTGTNTGGSGAGLAAGGGGGGAGGYAKKLIQITSPVRAATKTIVVGGISGTTSYTDTVNTLTAIGGGSGTTGAQSAGLLPRTGGGGGAATGGDINIVGNPGVNGFGGGASVTGSAGFAAASGGVGGSSPLGGGGNAGAIAQTNTAQAINGSDAVGYGGGGGGGCSINAVGSNAFGGNGAPGVVIITEYR